MRLAQVKQQPIELYWRTSWDFFTGGNGSKTGYITDLQETGCTLKTAEPIEFRRWIRMLIRDEKTNVSFTAVGRVVRCENAFEASIGSEVTLYRYRIEFTYPVAMARMILEAASTVEKKTPQPTVARAHSRVSLA